MDFKLVLIERETPRVETVATSGILLNNKHVITTSRLFHEELTPNKELLLQNNKKTMNYLNNKYLLNIIIQDEQNLYTVKKAFVNHIFISRNIKNFSANGFKRWSFNTIENNTDLDVSLSTFFILSYYDNFDLNDVKNSLKNLFELISYMTVGKCDELTVEGNPFGNRNFMHSISKGIVSNKLGGNSCLVLSDCPSSTGCEGSPAFLENCKYPFGMVLSSVSWWKGEWTGCTLIANFKSIIPEFIGINLKDIEHEIIIDNKIADIADLSLVQIYSSTSWGTAVLLHEEKGIFVTNSHVVENDTVIMYYKGRRYMADVIYRTPKNEAFDVALLVCKKIVDKERLKAVSFNESDCHLGDVVYAVGFSLFSKDINPSPTISKGCISQKSPYCLKTTCSVHPGSSGGAFLDKNGYLLGIIVCNTQLDDLNAVFPRINMGIPFDVIKVAIFNYFNSKDTSVLEQLHLKRGKGRVEWKKFTSKL